MFTITCCRTGTAYKPNMGKKGCFKRTFKDVNEFAKYLSKCWMSVYFPNLREEITPRMWQSAYHKCMQIRRNGSVSG